jgi:threonyl-tRNA synthetase
MPNITLPDGTLKSFDSAVTVLEVAMSIGTGLANAAIAGKANGQLVDLSHKMKEDTTLSIITARDEDGLEIIRHSAAHLLAQAVKQLFPSAQVTIGPVIEDGFYYDFSFERPFTPEDIEAIEARMKALVKENMEVSRRELPREEAIAYFESIGEHYKAEIIRDIPEGEVLSLYRQGDFEDLCRGPHVPSTGKIKALKLTKLAGAYWRGDSNNEMLQRIYGTAWADKKDLKAYLFRLEEAKKRDHRKIGKAQDLFHFQEEAPGMVFWHQAGWAIYLVMQAYMREKLNAQDYQEVRTPQVVDKVLWEKSGHWENFREDMFVTETENKTYAIKPMNCPCHVQVFNQGLKSYRDLPLRLAEFGNCHRCEPSGSLHGLMRVRNFVQDDAHVFCTEGQIEPEVQQMLSMVQEVYSDFGFSEIIYKLSTRPEKRVGSDEVWDKAEHALARALDNRNIEWDENPGEGAFYGPKIECSLKDSLGRVWQCGTIQVDFSMPARLEASYVAEDGSKQVPVMIHRAILGTFERFMGILIEHYAGWLPLWLSPIQVCILPISKKYEDYSRKILNKLISSGLRAKADLRNEKVSFKIREQTLSRTPLMLIVGEREAENNAVSVRTREGEDLGSMELESFLAYVKKNNQPGRNDEQAGG